MAADDHARGEEAETDHREEKKHVARIDHAFLNALEMRHHAEGRDRLHEPRACPVREQIGHRRTSRARIRNRQITTERMKLTTWLRVIAEVMADDRPDRLRPATSCRGSRRRSRRYPDARDNSP